MTAYYTRFATPDVAYRFSLRRIPLDRYGYDPAGCYYGAGAPLYRAQGDHPDTFQDHPELTFRASCRDAAKAHIREVFPNARFFR